VALGQKFLQDPDMNHTLAFLSRSAGWKGGTYFVYGVGEFCGSDVSAKVFETFVTFRVDDLRRLRLA
jgi:hypothetical protein